MADYSDIRYVATGVTEYATVDNLPTSGNSTGDQGFVTGTNRLYIWNGTGWYNIALINTTPSISGVSSAYTLATDGTATTVTITATDPEGLPIIYSIASDTSGNVATVTQGTGSNTNVFTITPSTTPANAGTFSLTFRASDGVNIATAVSEFTLEFKVENSKYTTALITSVGANNAVNNSFVDSSTNNHTVTANGNVTQNTFSPYRHGGYSTYFDGTGDYIRYDDASLAEGTEDFTVEFWLKRDGTQSQNDTIVGHDTTPGWQICFNTGNNLQFMSTASESSRVLSTGTLNDQQWYHVVYQRDSGTLQGFLDGVSLGTASVTTNFTNERIEIGVNRGGTAYFTGNVRDVRIIKGTAFYSSSGFDVPTEPLTAVSGTGYSTTLLSCHLPYIADGGANSVTPTVNGDTKVETFTPYDSSRYSPGIHGGSMYFDGSGDYLSSTITGPGTGDFTYEFWYYPTNSSFSGTSFNTRSSENSGADGFDLNLTSTSIQATYTNSIWLNVSTSAIKAFSWNHIALVRNSGTVTIYVNGISVGTASQTSNFSSTSFNLFANVLNSTGLSGNVTDFRYATTAVYTSSFTPPTAPLTAITNTQLLLSGTNAGIIDKSQSVQTLTLSGDVKSSTTQTKYLTSSIYFDGNSDYLMVPAQDSFELGSGDYTIECWVNISAAASVGGIFGKGTPSATANSWSLEFNGTNNYVSFWMHSASSSTYIITGSQNIKTSSWIHIAVTKSGNDTKMFVDGVQDGSTYTSAYTVAEGGNLYLGAGAYAPTTRTITGYISDFRITKGLARYTSSFTAPTAALGG